MFREHVPASLPWGASIPSFICEFIGLFNAEEKSELIIDGWAKNVVLSALMIDPVPLTPSA